MAVTVEDLTGVRMKLDGPITVERVLLAVAGVARRHDVDGHEWHEAWRWVSHGHDDDLRPPTPRERQLVEFAIGVVRRRLEESLTSVENAEKLLERFKEVTE